MCRGILEALPFVVGLRNHLVTSNDHRADRDIVVFKCSLGLIQRKPHQVRLLGQGLLIHP